MVKARHLGFIIWTFILVASVDAQSLTKQEQELFQAVRSREVSAVQKGLKKLSNAYSLYNEQGYTLLHELLYAEKDYLSQNGKAILQMLLDAGCDVNAKTKNSYRASVLGVATSIPSAEAMQMLISKGARVTSNELRTACFKRCLECVKILVENGVNVNAMPEGNYAEYPVVTLVQYQDPHQKTLPILKYLHEKGANLNVKSSKNETVMDLAIRNKNYPVKEYLESINQTQTNYDHTSPKERRCPKCDGSGTLGEQPVYKTCHWCNGKGGQVRREKEYHKDLIIEKDVFRPCVTCKGEGKVYSHHELVKCSYCYGKGFIKE